MLNIFQNKYFYTLFFISIFTFISLSTGLADDRCIFWNTHAKTVKPNILLLIDTGAESAEVLAHPDYDYSVDYTPDSGGFTCPYGYAVSKNAGYSLVKVKPNLTVPDSGGIAPESKTANYGFFTINGKTLRLPIVSLSGTIDKVKDKAGEFRYSANYLNWLFFSGKYTGDGTDLPDKSNLYYLKKAILTIVNLTSNKVQYSIFSSTGKKDIKNINNIKPDIYSPLAEMLAAAGGYFKKNKITGAGHQCSDNIIILISPGISSYDLKNKKSQLFPKSLSDFDKDNKDGFAGDTKATVTDWDTGKEIPVLMNYFGSTYADDVAAYLYANPFKDNKTIMTYTLGFAKPESKKSSRLFMEKISNNGNGFNNIDNSHLNYGKFYFEAKSPDKLAAKLFEAVSAAIFLAANTFTAPVIPVVATNSDKFMYMAFFKPQLANFWEGNLAKYRLSNNIKFTGKTGQFQEKPLWQIKDWADTSSSIYQNNQIDETHGRTIYTHIKGELIDFDPDNADIKNAVGSITFGTTTYSAEQIIKYVRGADILDQDNDKNIIENRDIITGDIMHSTPELVRYADENGNIETIRIFYGANDGMLHAVKDSYDPEKPLSTDGKEAWAFIPSDQLSRLKMMLGDAGHQDFIDSSPKVYISENVKNNRYVDPGEKAILVCGERKGGRRFFAIDISTPDLPLLLWDIDETDIPELGQSWSEPTFGKVMISDSETIPVCFLGGGNDISSTKIVEGGIFIVVNLFTGDIIRRFPETGSYQYSFPSTAFPVDTNGDDLIDKVYIGDLGGQIWRIANVDPSEYSFPENDQNIMNWTANIIFKAPVDSYDTNGDGIADEVPRKFYYPPAVTLEQGFDLVFITSGDRDDPCNSLTSEKVYCVADDHNIKTPLTESELVNVTNAANAKDVIYPNKKGWYINLGKGEKGLAKGTVFYSIYYFTTFVSVSTDPDDPDYNPCQIGGTGKLWGVEYRTGGTSDKLLNTMNFDQNRSTKISEKTIPPSPLIAIPQTGKPRILVPSGPRDIPDAEPLPKFIKTPVNRNYFELWWKPCEISD